MHDCHVDLLSLLHSFLIYSSSLLLYLSSPASPTHLPSCPLLPSVTQPLNVHHTESVFYMVVKVESWGLHLSCEHGSDIRNVSPPLAHSDISHQ